ncbi:DUF5776 domain-containing protein [Apilactobacillus xinyiensis]|uniref:DUF5776 domain-containing protein n=1 Tax=Apilactobacillus xinyiensis TaxID=2841032 RepID=UPI00200E8678|nr:DUF5776 domain-containing protein [Apilactobacillus xinyiensis]MCL0329827.1 DUF5776 domain-containing protein [Apilactobacillus xinyiensis]
MSFLSGSLISQADTVIQVSSKDELPNSDSAHAGFDAGLNNDKQQDTNESTSQQQGTNELTSQRGESQQQGTNELTSQRGESQQQGTNESTSQKGESQQQAKNEPTNQQSNNDSDYDKGYAKGDSIKNTVKKASSDAYNNKDNSGVLENTENRAYYDAAYNGVQDARKSYQNNTLNKGTSDSYESYDSSKDTDNDSIKANQNKYKEQLSDRYSENKNYSVSGDSVSIPSVKQVTNNTDSLYTDNAYLASAYKYGVEFFLSQQGIEDAESGKWNGTTQTSNGKSDTIYKPDEDSNNPYDRAYKGATDAINNQFILAPGVEVPKNYTGYKPLIINPNLKLNDSSDNYYSIGYNNVVGKIANGNRFVKTDEQLFSTYSYTDDGLDDVSINLIDDIKLNQPLQNQWRSKYLNLNGNNHILSVEGKITPMSDFSINNFRTIKFDDISCNTLGSKLSVKNSNIISNEGISFGDIDFSGNSNIIGGGLSNPYDTPTQVLNAMKTIKLLDHARVFVDSSSDDLQVFSHNKIILNNSSQLTLPFKDNGDTSIKAMSGSISVFKDALLNVSSSSLKKCSIIQTSLMSGNDGGINVIGGSIKVTLIPSENNVYQQYNYIYNTGSVKMNLQNGGSVYVSATDFKDKSFNFGSLNTNITDKGNLYVDVSNSPKIQLSTLLYSSIINDPGHVLIKASSDQINSFNRLNVYNVIFNGNKYYNVSTIYNGEFMSGISSDGSFLSSDSSSLDKNVTSLEFSGVPSAYFNGPIDISSKPDIDGNYVINGYSKIYNPQKDLNLYLQLKVLDNDTEKDINNNIKNDDNFGDDKLQFNTKISDIDTSKNMVIVPFTLKIPSHELFSGLNGISILSRYGMTAVNHTQKNISVSENNVSQDKAFYYDRTFGFNLSYPDKEIASDDNNVIYIFNTDNSLSEINYYDAADNAPFNASKMNRVNQSVNSSIEDIRNNQDKDNLKYNSSADYFTAYDATKAGYDSYVRGNSKDNLPVTVDNTYAYLKGYFAAQEDAKTSEIGAKNRVELDTKTDNSDKNYKYQINYANGYQDADNGYNKALNNPSSTNQSNTSVAEQIGFDYGKKAVNGAIDFDKNSQNGPISEDSSYLKGYNAAKQATEAAQNDLKQGKNNQSESGTIVIPDDSDKGIYKYSYDGAYNGENDALNNRTKADNNDKNIAYRETYDNAYKLNQKTDSGVSKNDNSNDSQKNNYPNEGSNSVLVNTTYPTNNTKLFNNKTGFRGYTIPNGVLIYEDANLSHLNKSLDSYKSENGSTMFKILGKVFNNNESSACKVQMISKQTGRLSNKILYISSEKINEVLPLYYTNENTINRIKVIGSKVCGYQNVDLTGLKNIYKQGQVLYVKSIVRLGSVYRIHLTNDEYITANKLYVSEF